MSAIPQTQSPCPKIAFKNVLMATDFSEASERAFTYAVAIARRYGSVLSVIHAVPPEPRSSIPLEPLPHELNRARLNAEQRMRQIGETPGITSLNPRLLLAQGHVWPVLAALLEHEKFDLLVLGTCGRSGLRKLALGSVAEEVLRMASCPVLTVGPNVAPAATRAIEFSRILFATDFEPASARALPYALHMAEDHQAKLVLMHMVPPMPCAGRNSLDLAPAASAAQEFMMWQTAVRNESENRLRSLVPLDLPLAAPPKYVVGTDFLPEGILSVAAASQSELIVMGADLTPFPRLVAHIPWALTHEVICHAKCPVLTVGE